MTEHAADLLLDASDRAKSPVCVGIDPVIDRLPEAIRPSNDSPVAAAEALGSFTEGVLDAVTGRVPCVKFQSACFERYHHVGVRMLRAMIDQARRRGLQVILDAKRGDIGISAEHYAAAAFSDRAGAVDLEAPNWLTINCYLGEDGIRPFLKPASGAFALVRTSNPGGDALQSRQLEDGRSIAECVADMVSAIGKDSIVRRG